ncbi:hypothetical protein NOF04DRAFT_1268323 [Fusarium oxysporum II5]|nr:hypothetical protein NOF04DRAFT_1268323 [Fusarium oxysporum II5]
MRLNLYVPILGKSNLQRAEYQLGPYLASFYGPVLFVIGVASMILNGLQVVVSAGTEGRGGWMRVVYLLSLVSRDPLGVKVAKEERYNWIMSKAQKMTPPGLTIAYPLPA